MKAMPGDRVRIRHRHAYGEGDGQWGTVDERQGKSRFLVVYDGQRKRRQEHDSHVVELLRAEKRSGDVP